MKDFWPKKKKLLLLHSKHHPPSTGKPSKCKAQRWSSAAYDKGQRRTYIQQADYCQMAMLINTLKYSPENERMTPKKGPLQKQNSLPTVIFQGTCSFSGGVDAFSKTQFAPKNRPGPERKGSSSNHWENQRAFAVGFREGTHWVISVDAIWNINGRFVGISFESWTCFLYIHWVSFFRRFNMESEDEKNLNV